MDAMSRHFGEQYRRGLVAGWAKPVSHEGHEACLVMVAAVRLMTALIGAVLLDRGKAPSMVTGGPWKLVWVVEA